MLRGRTVLLLLLLSLGLALGLIGARHRLSWTANTTTGSVEPALAQGPVYSMALPYEEPVVPPAPNQQQFVALCRLCHSPRLVLTQPGFPEKKWGEVVHKMVAVYGAPIRPEQERAIVAYLATVRDSER